MFDINIVSLKSKVIPEYSIYVKPELLSVYADNIEGFKEFIEPIYGKVSFDTLKVLIVDYVINLSIKYVLAEKNPLEYFETIELYVESYVESILNV